MSLQHILKNSSVSGKEPLASQLANGELSINYHADGPFLCCKDTAGNVRRVAGVWVSATAPSTPFPGELWLDIGITPSQLKVYKDTTDAWVFAGEVNTATTATEGLVRLATNAEAQGGISTTSAVTPAALQSKISDSTSTTSSTTIASSTAVKAVADTVNAALPKSGGTITGVLEIGNTGQLRFEGSTADAYETTLAVEDPTATRTITLPDRTGTVITTGDAGTVTSTMIADGTIVNADINANAEIAVSKLADGASRQLLQTDAAGTGVEWTSNVDIPGTLDVTGAAVFDSSVAVTGALTKSGNNVVTVGDTGTVATAMVADDAITYAKIQNVSTTDRLLGRSSAGAGDAEEITCTAAGRALLDDADAAAQRTTLGLGTLATQSGTFSGSSSGTNTGDQTITLTGDVTGSGTGSFAATIATGAVTSAKIADGTIVNADINASAAIAGTKISPDFGSQNLATTGRAGIGITNPLAPVHIQDDQTDGLTNTGLIVSSFLPRIVLNDRSSSHGWVDIRNDSSGGTGQLIIGYGANTDFGTRTGERLRIDSSGRLLVGTSTAYFAAGSAITAPLIQTHGTNANLAQLLIGSWATGNNTGGSITLARSESGTIGDFGSALSSTEDVLGNVRFNGSDGTKLVEGANISAVVDGTWATDNAPTRLVFSTRTDGSASPTERVRISANGRSTFGSQAASGAALTVTAPSKIYSGTGTYTDTATAASGTVTHGTVAAFDNPAIAATNATVTYTNASTVYIDGAPTMGTNVTITNPYALYVNAGTSFFGGNVNLSSGNEYRINNTKVVGARVTGWAAATGTATRTTFATSTVTTAELAERVKALIDDLISHGLIGT